MNRLAGVMLLAVPLCAQQPGSAEFFESKIRPVLANNCFGCHTNSAMGGLRVDAAEYLLKGGKRGPAVIPGDPGKSLLLTAVRHTDPALKMPMGNKLKEADIEALASWVKAGAPWPKSTGAKAVPAGGKFQIMPEMRNFWSLRPLKEPAVPAVRDAAWPKTKIDRFVLARLEQEGLKPVRPASRRDLIRRVTLDLTGLPPTFEDVDAFEKDTAPNAFAKVVDRLLESRHYGERWGRFWLDVARFGEDDYRSLNPSPKGYRPYPNAFAYRDWVINAMNDDVPYDLFVKAQLAGDLMDPPRRHKWIAATGFLGLGPWYYDNGAFEITRADERHDRVDVVTRGFLGLTAGCARCHDHKYDPIPQTDYYALAGVFQNTIYEEYPLAPKKTVDEYARIEEDHDRARKFLTEAGQNLANELAQSLAYQISNYLQAVWEVNGPRKTPIDQVAESRKLDFELLHRFIDYMARSTTKYKHKEAWRKMMAKPDSTREEARKLADEFQKQVVAVMLDKNEIDEENKVIFAKDLEGTKPKKRTDKPSNFVSFKDFNPGSWLQLKALPEAENNLWTEIFLRELGDSDDPNAMMGADGRPKIKPGLLRFRGWGLESRIGHEARARLESLRSAAEELEKKLQTRYPFVHGVRDAENPVDLRLHHRGDPENLVGPPLPRHFLTVLSEGEPAPFSKGSGRLELAEAIGRHPLATRVIVNRVWKAHFGTGLVDTPSNFGNTGERPSNPELLEYLAAGFRANGMSMKKLHREIVLSSVYQLSSTEDPVALVKDSGNRLYWRHSRKRLDAEQLRDAIMEVSGNLDKASGGPSEDLSPKMQRRTVYGKVSRYKPDEYLMLFDFPSPLISAEKRFVTTVPAQRLFLMNSDFMQLQAEEFAKRVAGEPNNRERIRKAYRLAYGREASDKEIALGLEYLKSEPLTEYEERGRKPADKKEPGEKKEKETQVSVLSKPAPGPADAGDFTPADGQETGGAMGQGMMAGMPTLSDSGIFEIGLGFGGGGGKRRQAAAPPPAPKYEATVWGRYAKVLLSSSEFLFIN